MRKIQLFIIFIILVLNALSINGKDNKKYYVVWYCSLKESPSDKSGLISLYPGDELEYLNEETEEMEEIFKWSEKNTVLTKFLKVKTENNEVGWVPEAFTVKKDIIDNVNSSKVSKTVKLLLSQVDDMYKDRFYSREFNDLDVFLDNYLSKKYNTPEHDDFISHLYGKGYKYNYCIASVIPYINAGSYYEDNPEGTGLYYIIFVLPIELRDELYDELVNKYGEPTYKPDGAMTGAEQTMWLTKRSDGFSIDFITYDPDMNDIEKMKNNRFFTFSIGYVAM